MSRATETIEAWAKACIDDWAPLIEEAYRQNRGAGLLAILAVEGGVFHFHSLTKSDSDEAQASENVRSFLTAALQAYMFGEEAELHLGEPF